MARPITILLHQIDHAYDILTSEGTLASAAWSGLIRGCRQVVGIARRETAHRARSEIVAVVYPQTPKSGLAQAHRLFQNGVERGCEIAGRGVDDLEDLGGGGLLLERLVTFRSGFRQLTLQRGYSVFALGAHLQTLPAVLSQPIIPR